MKVMTNLHDPQVKCRTDNENFEPDRSRLVGMFMPVLRCRELVQKSCQSVMASMPDNYSYGLCVIDGGSNDGTVEWCNEEKIVCYGNHQHDWPWATTGLCKDTPNAAIWALLGKYIADEDRFEKEGRYAYICWLHSDMNFHQVGWLENLVNEYEKIPDVGILGPATDQYDGMEEWMREGNVAPFIISVKNLKRHYKEYGWFYPPEMWFCVGYCDWAMHWRFKKLGLRSLVTRKSLVRHPMMGTREGLYKDGRQERDRAWEDNKSYYFQHYKTYNDPWNSQKI